MQTSSRRNAPTPFSLSVTYSSLPDAPSLGQRIAASADGLRALGTRRTAFFTADTIALLLLLLVVGTLVFAVKQITDTPLHTPYMLHVAPAPLPTL